MKRKPPLLRMFIFFRNTGPQIAEGNATERRKVFNLVTKSLDALQGTGRSLTYLLNMDYF